MSVSKDAIRSAIKKLLKDADLSSLSSKKVRKQLEDQFKCDLTQRKQEVDDILMAIVNAEEESDSDSSSKSSYNGESSSFHPPARAAATFVGESGRNAKRPAAYANSRSSSSDSGNEVVNKQPVTKKVKAKKLPADVVAEMRLQMDDHVVSKRLQEEELGLRPRKIPEKKLKRAAVGSTRTGKGRVKVCVLSEELAAVTGMKEMPRNQVVKRMWEVFRERNLIDPTNGQYIVCDEELEKIFKKKRVKAFTMMKQLANHVKDSHLIIT